ncbi:hypothetical protein QBC32DRAFT_217430 [Pseudoneurospora amorphoporcata]|uniref:Uncharacterized protein n=1 Tax=Pseudoneurospora amorphoporcata TaxID=241081 RepID=A0AAN6SEU9_9PEZI|nr:hypothetical protein QBC32DRAFT_217430 [Pseudoneurospora amorphoporcata]
MGMTVSFQGVKEWLRWCCAASVAVLLCTVGKELAWLGMKAFGRGEAEVTQQLFLDGKEAEEGRENTKDGNLS